MAGDTLESVALAVWGDASLWFKIADANGLFGNETLVAGTQLVIPNKVHNFHNTSDVYRVYDPNDAIGDTSPTRAKPPKDPKGCGVMGQILLVVVAVAVAYFTAGATLSLMGVGAATGTTGTAALMAEATLGEAIVAGAVGGAAGSVASQGVGLLTGIQKRFDWAAVGIAAIAGGVGAGLGPNLTTGPLGAFGNMAESIGDFGVGLLRGVTSNALTQGISMAVGLQKRFDWAGVAAAGILSGVSNSVGMDLAANHPGMGSFGISLVSGMAGAIAGAGAKTLMNGRSFGDNLMSLLPDAIGATIGNAIGEAVAGSGDPASTYGSNESGKALIQSFINHSSEDHSSAGEIRVAMSVPTGQSVTGFAAGGAGSQVIETVEVTAHRFGNDVGAALAYSGLGPLLNAVNARTSGQQASGAAHVGHAGTYEPRRPQESWLDFTLRRSYEGQLEMGRVNRAQRLAFEYVGDLLASKGGEQSLFTDQVIAGMAGGTHVDPNVVATGMMLADPEGTMAATTKMRDVSWGEIIGNVAAVLPFLRGLGVLRLGRVIRGVDPRILVASETLSGARDARTIAQLADSMATNGFDAASPIKVVEHEGRYIIVDGHHRAVAAVRTHTRVDIEVLSEADFPYLGWTSKQEVISDASVAMPHRLPRRY